MPMAVICMLAIVIILAMTYLISEMYKKIAKNNERNKASKLYHDIQKKTRQLDEIEDELAFKKQQLEEFNNE